MTDVEMLEEAIRRSGLTPSDYARTVLLRERRTVKRWLNRECPIPELVVDWLAAQLGVQATKVRRARRRRSVA